MSNAKDEFKIVLLGEGRVGKTSLLSRFINDTFNEQEQSTTQATMYSVKTVPIDGHSRNGPSTTGLTSSSSLAAAATATGPRSVKLAVWDTAGQERFHALAPIYYRNAAGALLVYDVCDADSLRKAQTWVRELRTVTGHRIRLLLCGNKCDRPASEQEVSPAEALAVAAEYGAEHFFMSAKTGLNVAEVFGAMAAAVYADSGAGASATANSRGGAVAATGGGGGGAAGASHEVGGRRRRRRGVAADGDGAHDLFVDYGDGDAGLGLRNTADYYDADPRPPRAARPLTLADMADTTSGNDNNNGSYTTSGGGGGCC